MGPREKREGRGRVQREGEGDQQRLKKRRSREKREKGLVERDLEEQRGKGKSLEQGKKGKGKRLTGIHQARYSEFETLRHTYKGGSSIPVQAKTHRPWSALVCPVLLSEAVPHISLILYGHHLASCSSLVRLAEVGRSHSGRQKAGQQAT